MKHSQLLPLNDESMIKCHLKKFFFWNILQIRAYYQKKKKSSGK